MTSTRAWQRIKSLPRRRRLAVFALVVALALYVATRVVLAFVLLG